MRSLAQAIAGIDAPTPPRRNSLGRRLLDLESHQCRFPLRGFGAETRFCAVEISTADWRPGFSGGSYCRFHRNLVVRVRGTEGERTAPLTLKRLG